MIFCRTPEHRNALDTQFSRFRCCLNRTQRLVQRKDGAAKQTNLLSGDQGERTRSECGDVLQGLLGGAETFVLPVKNLRHAGTALSRISNVTGFVFRPFQEHRRTTVKGLSRRSALDKIQEQARGVRNLAEWKTMRFQRWHPITKWNIWFIDQMTKPISGCKDNKV